MCAATSTSFDPNHYLCASDKKHENNTTVVLHCIGQRGVRAQQLLARCAIPQFLERYATEVSQRVCPGHSSVSIKLIYSADCKFELRMQGVNHLQGIKKASMIYMHAYVCAGTCKEFMN